jgi:hypothetical protein
MLTIEIKKPERVEDQLKYYEVKKVLDLLGLNHKVKDTDSGMEIKVAFIESTVHCPFISEHTVIT